MPTRKTIVCLANSKKYQSFCVAGVELGSNEWIRPVGSGGGGAVTSAEQTLADGTRPGLLDVVEIPLSRAAPEQGQPENWTLARGRWRKTNHLEDDEARRLLEDLAEEELLFGTDGASISGDDVQAGAVESSLVVVQPEDLIWTKRVWPERWEVRCRFSLAGVRYDFPVTDLEWRAMFAQDRPGDWGHDESEEVFLVVSLGGADRNNRHWKLVAGDLPSHLIRPPTSLGSMCDHDLHRRPRSASRGRPFGQPLAA